MEPKEERETMQRKVDITVRGPDDAVISILRGGESSDPQSLTFEQTRQLMFQLQDALFQMEIRREK